MHIACGFQVNHVIPNCLAAAFILYGLCMRNSIVHCTVQVQRAKASVSNVYRRREREICN